MLYHMASFPVTLSDFNYYKPPIFAICIAFPIVVVVEIQTSNLLDRLNVASGSNSHGW